MAGEQNNQVAENIQDNAPATPPETPSHVVDTGPKQAAPPKTFTEAEVNARIQAVRQEEKNKLYGDIEKLKKEVEGSTVELNRLKAELKAKTEEFEAYRAEALKNADAAVKTELERLQKENEIITSRFDSYMTETNDMVARVELSAYKKEVIREKGIEIPELIVGKTKGEIDASVAIALERQNAYAAKVRETLGQEAHLAAGRNVPAPANVPASPQAPAALTPGSGRVSAKDLAKMDDRAYEAYQAARKEQAFKSAGFKP